MDLILDQWQTLLLILVAIAFPPHSCTVLEEHYTGRGAMVSQLHTDFILWISIRIIFSYVLIYFYE